MSSHVKYLDLPQAQALPLLCQRAEDAPSSSSRRLLAWSAQWPSVDHVAKKAKETFGSCAAGLVWGLAFQKDRFDSRSSAYSMVLYTRATYPPAFFSDYTSCDREKRLLANKNHVYYTQVSRLKYVEAINVHLQKLLEKDKRTAGEIVALRRLLARTGADCSSATSVQRHLRKLLVASHPDKLLLSRDVFDAHIQRRQSRCFFEMTQKLKTVLFEQGDIQRVLGVPGNQQLDAHFFALFRALFYVILQAYCSFYCAVFRPDLTIETKGSIFCPLVSNVGFFLSSEFEKEFSCLSPDGCRVRHYELALLKESRVIKMQTWADAFRIYPVRFVDDSDDPCLREVFWKCG